ncbi:hypothetical protein BCR43DRAFT_557753 [Syncephalastrum racemosum]|uniref:DUF962 domain protein n=1 Tax=Syncephalastrum racemosum TaxID=13706 RepID=A0A1X2HB70_SYNRA|nr:hypothetical protein BCR43DRAFT_557753 [Syncephalastrum racemosum]
MPLADIFSLKKQLVLYGAHHNNKVNVAIHMVFVPVIFWTALVFGARTGPLVRLPASLSFLKPFGPNLSFFTVAGYSLYYTLLDPIASALYAPFLYGMCYTATNFERQHANAIPIALTGHVVAWIAQFLGHGVAEKRSPRLMDNLVQALVSAPYFVFFEVLFKLGYRPQLYKEMMEDVNKDIAEFRRRKGIKDQ